jgi:hypothetical protein
VIDIGSLGASDCHHAKVIARELFLEAGQGLVDHLRGLFVEMVLVFSIQLIYCCWLVGNFMLEIADDVLVVLDMAATGFLHHLSLAVGLEVTPSEVVHPFWCLLLIPSAHLLDSFLVDLIQMLLSPLISLLLEQEVVQSAGEAIDLHVV